MVFVTYRECLDEIVERLNTEQPLVRATRFVGQGADRQGKKGFAQKEQLEVGLLSLLMLQSLTVNIDRSSRSLKTVNSMCWWLLLLVKRGSISERLT